MYKKQKENVKKLQKPILIYNTYVSNISCLF